MVSWGKLWLWLDFFLPAVSVSFPGSTRLENGGPGLSRCMGPIENGDIPASYVIVYQRVDWIWSFLYLFMGWDGIGDFNKV